MSLPFELYTYIFEWLSFEELLDCRCVCHYFNHLIKSHPWNNHLIKLTSQDLSRIHWFLSNYNFRRFKIKSPDIQLNDKIWEILSRRNQIYAKVSHMTDIFDRFSFEIINETSDSDTYFIFSNNILIPYALLMINHLIKLKGRPNGTIQKVLAYALGRLDKKLYPYINTKYVDKMQARVMQLLDSYGIGTSYFVVYNVDNVEQLQYYIHSCLSLKKARSEMHLFLINFLCVVSKIQNVFLLEEMQRIIKSFDKMKMFSNVSDLILLSTMMLSNTQMDTHFSLSLIYKIDPKNDLLCEKILKKMVRHCNGRYPFEGSSQVLLPIALDELANHIRNITVWKDVKDFCKYHTNFVYDITHYDADSLFSFGDEFLVKVLQKEKYQHILDCVRTNPLLNTQLVNLLAGMKSKPNNSYVTKLNISEQILFSSHKRKLLHVLCLDEYVEQVYSWLLIGYNVNTFLGIYQCYGGKVNLTKLLLSKKGELAQYVIDHGIKYNLTLF